MHDVVRDYYGAQLQNSGDLKTSACCDASAVPQALKPLLARIHPEVLARYYGCGLVCPPLLEGARILDLGWAGRAIDANRRSVATGTPLPRPVGLAVQAEGRSGMGGPLMAPAKVICVTTARSLHL